MINIVNAILCRDGKILLAKRSPSRKAYANKWSFPGGHVEQGETLSEALKRELDEELSITPMEFSLIGKIDDPNVLAGTPIRYHMFLVTRWGEGEPVITDEEHAEIAWMSPATAVNLDDLALIEYREIFLRLSA